MRMLRYAAIVSALALAGVSQAALAGPDLGPPPPPGASYPDRWERPAPYHGAGPAEHDRMRWIDECADRIGGRHGRAECARYLDDYFASYMRAGPAMGGYPTYAAPCCTAQPVVMAPQAVRSQPECTETVTETYIDVPVAAPRPRPRPQPRVAPDKRIRVVPDKRIRN